MKTNMTDIRGIAVVLLLLTFASCAHHRTMEQRLSRIEARQDAILQTLRIVGAQAPGGMR